MASLRRRERSPYWWACFSLPTGKRVQRSTKVVDDGRATSRREAQRLADAWEAEIAPARTARQAQRVAAAIIQQLHKVEVPEVPIRWLEQWADRHEGEVSNATLAFYRGKARLFVEWAEDGERSLASISPDDVRRFRDHEARELSPRTVNNTIKTLRMAFDAAKREGLIADNPAEGIRALKTVPAGRRPFTLSELTAVLEIASPEWSSMIRFGYYTGQRLKDLALLRWSNLDLTQQEIRFVTRKTARRQTIPISSSLLEHILSLDTPCDPEAPVHPQASALVQQTGRVSTLSRQFGDILASAGLVDDRRDHKSRGRGRARPRAALSFHSLRDTATTQLKAAGVDGPIAQEIIGHDSEAMSLIYTKFDISALRSAVDRLARI